ncbi:serine--tRNA ligase [Aliarcobacter butzleri]|uniref:Serine--tRNA ligase n=4 Tax=Aliarcobacter butzleri TaxID=28197 RepID=SYS_ALIB4|nr:serine--tRNA ligase [Aliarcobacter butzleri]A8ERP6.1 RecName: Full=Serine--tRNA ligase; AltName: Full=Seryl-tRNA synthetase; Short=SerRS; AltName: Full=Seryl-tRNA(Ser/Sec) synthetase [Aliarcobacter butzleri RM4018]ABV66620.1 seryl-tRNA synthetase [Aliarcobacter butzleri RM4018]KLD99407.1 seryl-tRNA synthetase [Aliarcobacter butzleri L348]KLE04314.1 seryl-tRNA synthetase [Aliarcobacter butzleri L353]KLE07691.1 seryl-tRNA synthetase [Aliarcobacter butzleri L354]KLE09327.1 seryl-tRNA syntheta
MIDIKLLQKDFDYVVKALQKKGVDNALLNNLKDLALKTKQKRQEMEDVTAEQNLLSKEFGRYKKENLDISELQEKINALKTKKQELEDEVRTLEDDLNSIILSVPNMPDENVPFGVDENENVILEVIGEKPTFNFTPKEHWDLSCDWLDFERGVKLAKSRFTAIKGDGARLERALINYMLDFNRQRGFNEWYVPFMANSNTLQGTGQLPKFADDLFKIEGEDLYLIPTAEVSLTNLYNDEIIDKSELPLLLTSYTPCFRKEAGSAGRDTRGLIRQHQFDKVEMVAITSQEQSDEIFEKMVNCASDLLSSLGLCHQKVQLCSGDLGFSAAVTIDLEVWLPGQNKFREISSISNTRDFQARRAKIRYKEDKKNILAHTLNGSSLAVGRTLLAIMENYQQADGSVKIPEVLKKYL